MQLSFYEVAVAVHATNDYKQWEDFQLSGAEFDSRRISEGELFIPLQGQTDGHTFLTSAIQGGAIATLWSKEEAPKEEIPYLQVDDVLESFQALAQFYRQKINPTVIAVTGSNGKTTTKDLTAAVLATEYRTYKTQGNYNNDIGLPYTILHMPVDTEMLVLEMGMDGAHQIDRLSEIAMPDIACITMVGESHIENLGSRNGIAKAKMEITYGLKENGTLIIPADEPLLLSLAEERLYRYVTFGMNEGATIQGKIVERGQKYTIFKTNYNDEELMIPIPGPYNVKNALIAIFVGVLCKVSFSHIRNGLSNSKITQNRSEWLTSQRGIEIFSDVYNANPTAMHLVLDNFSELSTDRNKIVVLGDMLELGEKSRQMHEEMEKSLHPDTITDVYLYGPMMKYLYECLKDRYDESHLHYFEIDEKEQMMHQLESNISNQDMVLLKASNGMGLSEVVERLLQ